MVGLEDWGVIKKIIATTRDTTPILKDLIYTKHYMQKKTTHDEYHLLHFHVQEVGTKKDMEIEWTLFQNPNWIFERRDVDILCENSAHAYNSYKVLRGLKKDTPLVTETERHRYIIRSWSSSLKLIFIFFFWIDYFSKMSPFLRFFFIFPTNNN